MSSPQHNIIHLLSSVTRYVKLHQQLFGKYDGELMAAPTKQVLRRIKGTFEQFLVRENLQSLIPVFIGFQTAMGYEYIDEVAALYGLLWNTPKFLITIALRSLQIYKATTKSFVLKEGFEKVWSTAAKREQLDVHFEVDIDVIHRSANGSELHYWKRNMQYRHWCDFLIWAAPMTEFLKNIRVPTKSEKQYFGTLTHKIYSTSLMHANNSTRNGPIAMYAENIERKTEHSILQDIDMDGIFLQDLSTYKDFKVERRLTTVCQYGKDYINEAELHAIVKKHYSTGFTHTDIEIFNTISWPYFYRWNPHEVADGIHWKVFNMQGVHRTWYAGSSVSFETIKSVMEYNNLLLRQMS